jgi:hypothetical protein
MDNIITTDPSNEDSLVGVFNTVLDKFKQSMQVRLPCVVTAINKDKNSVSIIPLIKMVMANGTSLRRATIVGVPIQHLSAGGFIIHMPVKVGDFGYIRSCDRDISLFKQSFSESIPNTKRKITFEDSVFIPDTINYNNYTIDSEDDSNLVLQSFDNSVKISLGLDNIKIKAPTINIEGNVNIQGNVSNTGTLQNNGVNVGSTHVHIQTNSKPTSVPQ